MHRGDLDERFLWTLDHTGYGTSGKSPLTSVDRATIHAEWGLTATGNCLRRWVPWPHALVVVLAIVAILALLVVRWPEGCGAEIVVTETMEVRGVEWNLSENITIMAGGTLRIMASKVTFLCEEPMQYGIDVRDGGQLVVKDLDGDPSTTSDRSVLDGSERFFLIARTWSRLNISNSMVSRCGRESPLGFMEHEGVELETSDFEIRGTVFCNSTGGLYLNSSSGGRVSGCTFSGMMYGIRGVGVVSLKECVFDGLEGAVEIIRYAQDPQDVIEIVGCVFRSVTSSAVSVHNARSVHVEECSFKECNKGLYLKGHTEDPQDLVVSNCSFSGGFGNIELINIIGAEVRNNDFTDFSIAIQTISVMYTVADLAILDNMFHDGGTGISLDRGRNLTIAGNSFTDVMVGINPYSHGVLITGNDFERVSNAGVLYEGEGVVEVVGNRFTDCTYGLKVQRDLVLRPGLKLVNNTFEGNHVGALLREVEPLVLEGDRWEGGNTGLQVIGSDLDIEGGIALEGCRVGIALSAVKGTLHGVPLTNCVVGVVADLGSTVILDGCLISSCGLDVSAGNISTITLLDCQHSDNFELRDEWSEVRLVWTCTLELVYASDGAPAPLVPCELVPASTPSMGWFESDGEGRVGPRRVLQAVHSMDGVVRNIPYTVNLEVNAIVHPFIVPFAEEHTFVLVLDDIPPVMDVMEPADGARFNTSVVQFSVALHDSESSVSALTVEVDGEDLLTLPDPGPEAGAEVTVADGNHTARVGACDAWGNECHAILNFEVDTVPPELVIASPKDGALTNLTEVLVEGIVVGAVHAELGGVPLEVGAIGAFSVMFHLPREGENTILLAAWDAFENEGAVSVIVVRDTEAPRLIVVPLPALTCDDELDVSGWTDGRNLRLNGEDVPVGADGCFTIRVALMEGENSFAVTATDPAGNARAVTVACRCDRVLEFTISFPVNGGSIENASVTATGAGEVGLRFHLAGEANWTSVGPSGDFRVILELPMYGTNTFEFTIEDEAGNRGAYLYSLNRTGRVLRTEDGGRLMLYLSVLAASVLIIVAAVLLAMRRGGEEG